MKRGDVFIADIEPRSGSEQAGRRPVVIVSNDGFNKAPNWGSIIVVPFSSSINQARRSLTSIPIFEREGGLTTDSIALCHQVTTLDRSKLRKRLGELDSEQMLEIEIGLKAAMRLS